MLNAFTVDVEEWFHICGLDGDLGFANWPNLPSRVIETTDVVLDLLDRRSVCATFFVLGWVADRWPTLVARIKSAGHEIASHGHRHDRAYELTAQQFEADLDRSLTALAEAGAPAISGYRAPEWSINDGSLWALDVLARRGLRFDSSMTPLKLIGNPSYPQVLHRRATASGAILEFPPLVARWVGQNVPIGGGWALRMSTPLTVLKEIERKNRAGEPAMLFIHPWELDPAPPRIKLPIAHQFAHYFRLSGFAHRLNEILGHARFGSIGQVLDTMPAPVTCS